MEKRKLGLGLAAAGPVLWGSSGTVAQNLFDHHDISPTWLVAIRMIFAGLLLLVYGATQHQDILAVFKNKHDSFKLLLFTLFGMTAVQLTYFMAISTGNAATATILQYLSPIMIILYLAIKDWVLPSRIDALSVIIAIIGTALIVTQGNFQSLALPLPAIIWGILAAVGAAVYTLMPQQLLQRYGAIAVVGWSMFLGGIITGIYYRVWEATPSMNLSAFIQILFVIIFGTMLAYLFFLQSLEYILPTTASVLGAIEPMSAAILSFLFLHVSFNLYGIIGILFVISVTFLQFIYAQKMTQTN